MSEALAHLIERASIDAAFRSQLQSHPEAVVAGYDLTAEEKAALLSGDPAQLVPLGLDVRNTKQGFGPGPGPIDISMPTSEPFR